jgi:hypothetical protein
VHLLRDTPGLPPPVTSPLLPNLRPTDRLPPSLYRTSTGPALTDHSPPPRPPTFVVDALSEPLNSTPLPFHVADAARDELLRRGLLRGRAPRGRRPASARTAPCRRPRTPSRPRSPPGRWCGRARAQRSLERHPAVDGARAVEIDVLDRGERPIGVGERPGGLRPKLRHLDTLVRGPGGSRRLAARPVSSRRAADCAGQKHDRDHQQAWCDGARPRTTGQSTCRRKAMTNSFAILKRRCPPYALSGSTRDRVPLPHRHDVPTEDTIPRRKRACSRLRRSAEPPAGRRSPVAVQRWACHQATPSS